jgi:hypothetical protein
MLIWNSITLLISTSRMQLSEMKSDNGSKVKSNQM